MARTLARGRTKPAKQKPLAQEKEPSALSEGIHTALDVIGMIPLLGEVADGANAAMYAAEGDYANAALSAAAMVPGAGNVVGAAKLAKRGAKLLGKVRGLKKAKDKAGRLAKATKRNPRLPEHVVDPPFKPNKKHSDADFDGQLQGQERGLNDLTVDEYIKNRDRYLKEGRAPEGSRAQNRARDKAIAEKEDELLSGGKSPKEAKAEAKKWAESQNALHNPDQIAGGNPEKIDGLGDSSVNQSIGSQWDKHKRAEKLDEHVRGHAEKMTLEQRKKTKRNVKLPKIRR